MIDAYIAVFFQREGEGSFIAVLHFGWREAEPSAAHAKCNLFSTYFNYGVLCCIQSMSGCITAKQGSPGGPEFGMKTSVQFALPKVFNSLFNRLREVKVSPSTKTN